jgi:hypothetical protein
MKKMVYFVCLFAFFLFVNGCLTYDHGSLTFDYGKDEVIEVFHDIGSEKGSDIEKDWETLKGYVLNPQSWSDSKSLEGVKAELFEENGALSGRIFLRVKSIESFSSKAAVLAKLFENRAEMIDGEIFLFIPIREMIITSSNAEILKTKSTQILVWPENTVRFEICFAGEGQKEKTLLPYYLKEKL